MLKVQQAARKQDQWRFPLMAAVLWLTRALLGSSSLGEHLPALKGGCPVENSRRKGQRVWSCWAVATSPRGLLSLPERSCQFTHGKGRVSDISLKANKPHNLQTTICRSHMTRLCPPLHPHLMLIPLLTFHQPLPCVI